MTPVEALIQLDREIFLALNGFFEPLGDFFYVLTVFGEGLAYGLLIPLACLLAIRRCFNWKRYGRLLAFFGGSMIAGALVTQGIKHVVKRDRPPAVKARKQLPDFNLIGPKLMRHSFPSGHSQGALTFTLWLGTLFGWTALWLLLGLLMALSRVAVGVHFPLDILAGSALGILFWWLGSRLHRRYAPEQPAATRETRGR